MEDRTLNRTTILPPAILIGNIFSRISFKINFSNKKGNQSLLAIDILKDQVKKDLLYITSQNVERVYSEIAQQASPSLKMAKGGDFIFLQLVNQIWDEFFIKEYGYTNKIGLNDIKHSLYFKYLLADLEILFKIPFFGLMDMNSLNFLRTYYPVYTSASEAFLEAAIDNLIIEIANCIVYTIITKFSVLYSIRQTIYRSKFLSVRNYERFKNNLIWQLKIKTYVDRPTSIYNSTYSLFLIRTTGICSRTVYANTSQNLTKLKNLPLGMVSIIEVKDFLQSRVDELIYALSKGIRFFLTSIIGQFIGLVWRGIIESLKNYKNT